MQPLKEKALFPRTTHTIRKITQRFKKEQKNIIVTNKMQCIISRNKQKIKIKKCYHIKKKKRSSTHFSIIGNTLANFRLSPCVQVPENSQITSWGKKFLLSKYIHNSEDKDLKQSFPYWAILLFT